jgi:uncharacterized membrane protein
MGEQTSSRLFNPTSIRIGLVASLGLNLFFAGWLVGARVVPWGFGPPPGPMQRMSEDLRRSLSDDGFKIISGLVRELESSRTRQFDRTGPQRDKFKTALTAEPFDRDAFAKVLNDLNTDISRRRAELDNEIVNAVARLTLEDRRRLAELPLPPPPPGGGFGPNFLPIDRPPPPR